MKNRVVSYLKHETRNREIAGGPHCFLEPKPSIVSFLQLLKEFLPSIIIFQLKYTIYFFITLSG